MSPVGIDDGVLDRIESEHPAGITSAGILEVLASLGVKFSESTLRKWVQLGLLPRSVRVGRKGARGKHSGSLGLYPATIVRQILRIKDMMAGDLTIEQIQRQVLFVRSDMEALERSLSKIFHSLESAVDELTSETLRYAMAQDISVARDLAQQLVHTLTDIEARLSSRATVGSEGAAAV